MTSHARNIEKAAAGLIKRDPGLPALIVTGPRSIAIRAGTSFDGHHFRKQTPVEMRPSIEQMAVGADYGVTVVDGIARAWRADRIPIGEGVIGGFHFAPGGNASADAGGDHRPAINPFSLWDLNFRPSCPDPRGMVLIEASASRFWCDIYLTGAEHLANGTSKFGVTIADGIDCPRDPAGGTFKRFDYPTAVAVMAHHGKGLLSRAEYQAAAIGVTEYSAARHDPRITGLDAVRTSRFGLMQATGNMWVWGHDGSAEPRPSFFGGGWWYVGCAGSRCAVVGYWLGNSGGFLGARGRSDHLQLA